MPEEWVRLDAGKVGEKIDVKVCEGTKYYKARIKSRDDTHTYLEHSHGEIALQNNIGIDLIAINRYE